MDLFWAKVATSAWRARLLTARGRPRDACWMTATASSLKRVSERPARTRWCLTYYSALVVMPTIGIVGRRTRSETSPTRRRHRHNHRLLRKASTASGARYRPGLTCGGVIRARARSLLLLDHAQPGELVLARSLGALRHP